MQVPDFNDTNFDSSALGPTFVHKSRYTTPSETNEFMTPFAFEAHSQVTTKQGAYENQAGTTCIAVYLENQNMLVVNLGGNVLHP